MKKFLLSGFVILTFLVYSLHERKEGSNVHVVAPSASSSPNNTTPTASSSSGISPNTNQNTPTSSNSISSKTPTPHSTQTAGVYKDGTYTGNAEDAYFGLIQVQAIVQNGKIVDVQFLQYPNDRSTSIEINQQAMPYLKQEAIQAQSSQVDIVSGATDSSQAFVQSLQSALIKAKG